MPEITSLDKMRLPFGGQEIEFQHLTHESGGVPFLRIRIRENKRFTIFDVDPVSAQKWADLMQAWARDTRRGCAMSWASWPENKPEEYTPHMIDLQFDLVGTTIPADNAQLLADALLRLLPWLGEDIRHRHPASERCRNQ